MWVKSDEKFLEYKLLNNWIKNDEKLTQKFWKILMS